MKPTDFSRSGVRTMSSPPDQGQPEFKFNHSANEFAPGKVASGPGEQPMETVDEVRDLAHDAPEFVPVGILMSPFEDPQEAALARYNLEAEEFTFTGKYASMETELAVPEVEFKPQLEEKPVSVEPVEDISTSDDEEYCAENRPLRPEDETDLESDYEEQPASEPTIPHSPLRETSVRLHIYNPEFILKIKQDELSQVVPGSISMLLTRKIEEIIVENRPSEIKRGVGRYQGRTQMVRTTSEVTPVDPNWRPVPTEDEKRIAEEAKRQTERIKAEKTEDEAIRRTIKITLNKLSPANFEKLKEQLLELSKQSDDNLRLMSQGIFDKAWSQPKFTQLYAGLCQYLDEYFANVSVAEPVSTRPKSKTKKNVSFM